MKSHVSCGVAKSVIASLMIMVAATGEAAVAQSASSDLTVAASVDTETHLFGEIEWMSRSGGGILAIADLQAGRVKFFDPDGRFLGSFGRRGQGPGEFTNMASAGWKGDTLWIADLNRRAVTFVGPDRRLLRVERWSNDLTGAIPEAALPVGAWGGLPRAYTSTNLVVVSLPERQKRATPSITISRQFVGLADNQGVVRSVMAITGARACGPSTGVLPVDLLLCGASYPAFSPTGNLFATIEDRPAPSGAERSSIVRLYGTDGRLLFSHTFSDRAVPLSRQVRDSLVDFFRRRGPVGAELEGKLSGRTFPVVDRVIVGADSVVWVSRTTDRGTYWTVLSAEGKRVTDVRLGNESKLRAVWRTGAWSILAGEDGLERIVRYELKQ